MNNLKDDLFVTAGIKTPVGHVDEARRLWRVGHRIIEAAVDGPADRSVDRKASADLHWVETELLKQLRQVELLVPGLDAGSLELFRLCNYKDGRRIVIDKSAGIAWTRSQHRGDLRADMNDWSDQMSDWFTSIRNQVADDQSDVWVKLRKAEINERWDMPDSNFSRLAKDKPELITKAGPKTWNINTNHPDLLRKK